MNYSVVGLTFDIIGAWLLAYEVAGFGHGERVRIRQMKDAIEKTQKEREELRLFLGDKANSEPDRISWEEFNKDFEVALETNIKKIDEKLFAKSFQYGYLGALLLTVGFVLQMLGALK